MQVESKQVCAVAQTVVHPPQWFTSLVSSTHTFEHRLSAPLQLHVPPEQMPPQGWLQAPQLASSVFRSTHTPLQSVEPVPQPAAVQVPPVQVPEHAAPQLPQLASSVCVSTQTPLQISEWSPVHPPDPTQPPPVQTFPVLQGLAQPPQF